MLSTPIDKTLSNSLQNLRTQDEEDISFTDKLKRSFSSIKRRKKKESVMPTITAKETLKVPQSMHGHRPLGAAKSNPLSYYG